MLAAAQIKFMESPAERARLAAVTNAYRDYFEKERQKKNPAKSKPRKNPGALFPGTVLVWQGGFSNFRVFLTGGVKNASAWIFGSLAGRRSFPSIREAEQETGHKFKRLGKGVFAVLPK